jgi:hypothetical protein
MRQTSDRHFYLCVANMLNFTAYIPLMRASLQQNIQCTLVLFTTGMPRNPKSLGHNHPFNHISRIKEIADEYGAHFIMGLPDELVLSGDILFTEKRGLSNLLPVHDVKIHILTRFLDFIGPNWFDSYSKVAQNIFFIGEKIASSYGKMNPANKYIGNPKYDTLIEPKDVYNKFGLNSTDNHVTILWPSTTVHSRPLFSLVDLCTTIREMGFTPLVKAKDRFKGENIQNDTGIVFINNDQFFPNPTMELLKISQLVLNFNSTAVEEAIFAEVPIINFSPGSPNFHCLYADDYSRNLRPDASLPSVKGEIKDLLDSSPHKAIREAKKKIFAVIEDSSRHLLNYIFQ